MFDETISKTVGFARTCERKRAGIYRSSERFFHFFSEWRASIDVSPTLKWRGLSSAPLNQRLHSSHPSPGYVRIPRRQNSATSEFCYLFSGSLLGLSCAHFFNIPFVLFFNFHPLFDTILLIVSLLSRSQNSTTLLLVELAFTTPTLF